MHAFINTNIITDEKAYIHIKDRGFLLGDGIFETIKVRNGHIEFFNAHYERFLNSANALFIPFSYTAVMLQNMCLELIKKNNLLNEIASIRITLTRGAGSRGIDFPDQSTPTLFITATKYHQPNCNQYTRSFITSIKRNPYSPITTLKTLNYLEPILARHEAKSHGFDEGIMLNTHGFITECSVANFFLVKDNIVMTPSIESGILPGIMRNHIINLCHKHHIKIIEKNISITDALTADEAFQTNSLIGIQLLSEINNHKMSAETFTVSKKIMHYYENEKHDKT